MSLWWGRGKGPSMHSETDQGVDAKEKSNTLSLLEIKGQARVPIRRSDLTRIGLLHECQKALEISPGQSQPAAHVPEEDGKQYQSDFFKASTERTTGVLHLRDLHCLQAGTEPIIHVRKAAIVINLPPIQGVVTNSIAYLLDQSQSSEYKNQALHLFLEKIKPKLDKGAPSPQFGAAILEAALTSVTESFSDQVMESAKEADVLLKKFRTKVKSSVLHRLKVFKRRLGQTEELIKGMHWAVLETLQEAHELMELLEGFSAGSHTEGSSAELWLDTAVTRLDEILTEIRVITHEIDNTEDNLRARLDNARNRMLKVGVGFGVMSVWVTAAQMIATMVGQNISSGLSTKDLNEQAAGRQDPGTTYVQISLGSGVGALVGTVLTILWLVRIHIL